MLTLELEVEQLQCNLELHGTATESRLAAGGQGKMKREKKKPKGNWCSRGLRWGFCFAFSVLEMCVCSTMAQILLLEEYKLLVFIAYSCSTALHEWQEHLCNLVWWMSQERCRALGQSACCSFEFGSNYHLIDFIPLFRWLETCSLFTTKSEQLLDKT